MLLIKNGYIKTMEDGDIENGYVLIGDDGKIASVGKGVPSEKADTVIDAEGRLVTPGCVEAHCHVGLQEAALRWEGNDINEKSDPTTPQLRAIDAINPLDEMLTDGLEYGVTTACTGPGSANVVGGSFVAIKLAGKCVDDMIVKTPLAMKCAFGENPKNVYGQHGKTPITRMATASILRELIIKAKNYLKAKEDGKEPSFDMKLEAMIPVIKKEIPLKAHAHRADDILTAIRIAKEFDLNMTLDHCTEGALIADEVLASGFPAFIGPSMCNKSKPELKNKSFSTVKALYEKGVPISIITDAPVTSIKYLPLCAGIAASDGLPEDAAWRAITITPATQTGIGDRVGSLAVGKDGDVVIWTANPLKTVGARAYVTIVDGKIVHSL